VDGVLDWYLLGVATGLGVAGVLAIGWLVTRAPAWLLGGILLVGATAGVVVIALVVVGWALVGAAGGILLTLPAVRRLVPQALPAATLTATALALLPLLGFAEALLAPVAGARLGRRADSRYAGLRVLAKD
jgi:hypothetical protein